MTSSEQPPTVGETTVKALLKLVQVVPIAGPGLSASAEVIWGDVRARREARATQTIAEITVGTGGEKHLAARLGESPELEAVFVKAVDAAIRTGYEHKRRLLARAVVQAATDDALFDESALLVDTLTELDLPHVRALAKLEAEIADPPTDSSGWGWGASPAWKDLPAPIQAALVRVGAARPSQNTLYYDPARDRPVDGISNYGLEILNLLKDDAGTLGLDGGRVV